MKLLALVDVAAQDDVFGHDRLATQGGFEAPAQRGALDKGDGLHAHPKAGVGGMTLPARSRGRNAAAPRGGGSRCSRRKIQVTALIEHVSLGRYDQVWQQSLVRMTLSLFHPLDHPTRAAAHVGEHVLGEAVAAPADFLGAGTVHVEPHGVGAAFLVNFDGLVECGHGLPHKEVHSTQKTGPTSSFNPLIFNVFLNLYERKAGFPSPPGGGVG